MVRPRVVAGHREEVMGEARAWHRPRSRRRQCVASARRATARCMHGSERARGSVRAAMRGSAGSGASTSISTGCARSPPRRFSTRTASRPSLRREREAQRRGRGDCRAGRDAATARPRCGLRARRPQPAQHALVVRRRATRTRRRIRARAAPARRPTARPAASAAARRSAGARDRGPPRRAPAHTARCGGAIQTTSRRSRLQPRERGQREADLADAFALEQDLGQRALRPAAAGQHGVERARSPTASRRARARNRRRARWRDASSSGGEQRWPWARLDSGFDATGVEPFRPAVMAAWPVAREDRPRPSRIASMRVRASLNAGPRRRCWRAPDHCDTTAARRSSAPTFTADERAAPGTCRRRHPNVCSRCARAGADASSSRGVVFVARRALGIVDDADAAIAIGGDVHEAAERLRARRRRRAEAAAG